MFILIYIVYGFCFFPTFCPFYPFKARCVIFYGWKPICSICVENILCIQHPCCVSVCMACSCVYIINIWMYINA